jgi:type IV secretory pathway VirB2 component (pilin)
MTTLLFLMPWVASLCGAVMIGYALRLWEVRPAGGENRKRLWALACAALAFPSLAHAQAADLQQAVEAGNGIIMYLSGTFAAVGIVAAGIAMMTGRHAIAKWALAGAVVSGLAFAIVRTIWESAGLTAPDVGTF